MKEVKINNIICSNKVSFKRIFFVFVIMSIVGSLYEQILFIIQNIYQNGEFVWERRAMLLYGPFNIVYGVGAVAIILILNKKNISNLKIFVYGSLLGGFIEFIMSYIQEVTLKSVFWDYQNHFLNIDGRTTIPYMLFWGLATLFFIKIVYPNINVFFDKIPKKFLTIFTSVLIIFFLINFTLTVCALHRANLRDKNIYPSTFVGEFCDKYYTDEYLDKAFPNLIKRS